MLSHIAAVRAAVRGGRPYLRLGAVAPLALCEIHKDTPIIGGHGVFALPYIIAQPVPNKLAQRRHLLNVQSRHTKKSIHWVSGFKHFELASGISPLVLLSGGEEYCARSTQGNEAILVKRQTFGHGVELFERPVEPMREVFVDDFNRLPDLATTRRGTAAAGLMRKGNADAIVERSSE